MLHNPSVALISLALAFVVQGVGVVWYVSTEFTGQRVALSSLHEDVAEVKQQISKGSLPRSDERIRLLERDISEIKGDLSKIRDLYFQLLREYRKAEVDTNPDK